MGFERIKVIISTPTVSMGDVVLETKVLVLRCLEDKKRLLDLGFRTKSLRLDEKLLRISKLFVNYSS